MRPGSQYNQNLFLSAAYPPTVGSRRELSPYTSTDPP